MDLATLPILSLQDEPQGFARAMGESFRSFGFSLVRDHGLDPALIAQGWDTARAFFALPENAKARYRIPGQGGARGYTPFGVEIAKGARAHDLKEFWHVGRDLPPGDPRSAAMPPNIWPVRPEDFRKICSALFAEFDRVGNIILSRIALDLGLPEGWFAPATAKGNSVLRLLHYPPIGDCPPDAMRAEAHGDINLITLLLGAEEAGLELLTREGNWLPVSPPEGALVVNIGDMLERLTNRVLPSTLHRVRNPTGERARFSRYAMPFFLHLRSDFPIATLPQCITPETPDRYPDPITADEFLQQRLREIGLFA